MQFRKILVITETKLKTVKGLDMIEYKQNLGEEEKVIFLRALLFILGVEKRSSDCNQNYLIRQAEQIGFDQKELKNIKKPKKADELAKELKTIANIRIKRFILREMILLAVADHELTDGEMSNIYDIGIKAGIKEEKINDFFLWAAQGLEWQMEGSRLIEKDI